MTAEVVTTPGSSGGRLPPLERLEALCDPHSLERLGAVAEAVGVHAVRGRVAGRPVVAYAQDSRVAGGSVGVAEADVIVGALRHSGHTGVPLVAFLESAGARLQEGASALGGFGRIFTANVGLWARVPQISVITGTSAGGGCYSPALTDFVVMTEQATMFLTGPRIVRQALGEDVSAHALGGPPVHERNGVCHLVAPDDLEAIALVRELLGHLPQSAAEPPPSHAPEPPAGGDPAAVLPANPRSFYDVRAVVARLVDGGRLLELWHRWARNMVVGLARLDGRPIGIVANQSRHLGGIIDSEASQKAARFIATCRRFAIPLLVLVDTPGFMPGTRQEAAGVIRHGAELLRAFAGASVPRVTVVLRRAYGGAFISMNCKDLGASAALAWPDAEIGIMSAEGAVQILHRRELDGGPGVAPRTTSLADRYARTHLSAAAAVRRGVVDAIIEPRDTRAHVAEALFGRPHAAWATRGAGAGCTIWLTGLPGAGKSTVAELVAGHLRACGERVEVLDGDVVRQNLSKGLGFSREDRDTNIRRIAFVADMLSRNGVSVIVAAISPFRETRDEARALIGERFIEVHVRASPDECARRDPKGHYARALRGELTGFTGVSDPYEEPLRPELVLDTDRETPQQSAAKVLSALAARRRGAEVAA